MKYPTRNAPDARDACVVSDTWAQAGRRLLVKAVEEFAYEELLVPVPDVPVPDVPVPGGPVDRTPAPPPPVPTPNPTAPASAGPVPYRLDLGGGVRWTFRATRGPFAAWRVEPGSLRRHPDAPYGQEAGPERLLLDARATLGWDGPTTAEALRELTATRSAQAEAIGRALPAADLADLGHLDLEAYQDGHPAMLLNKGRLGFSASDAAAYAPESARAIRLTWVAVHTDLAAYSGVPGLDAEQLLAEELDLHTRIRFSAALDQACAHSGLPADEFVWLPVHPFHWDEAVAPLFAPYIADSRLVLLGQSADRYRPLQSIRTLANLDHPRRRNVKLPLLIRNTLRWRGLATEATEAAPDVSAWLHAVRDGDPYLRDELRFHPLGEVAAVAVGHPLYESVKDAPYRYHELLGAVWREPVTAQLRERERARTMASLLTTGSDGRTLTEELVARSGLSGTAWLSRFLGALLPGLLHYLYRYGVAFRPHGENTVVLFDRREFPVGVAVKDVAEDVSLLPGTYPERTGLSERADRVLPRRPAPELAHSLLSAVFSGHFRFFAPLAAEHLGVPEGEFWGLVRAEVERYHGRFPELAHRIAPFGLLAPSFPRVALNREQLLGRDFHDRTERGHDRTERGHDGTARGHDRTEQGEDFGVVRGTVANPLARRTARPAR
ncbi:IucA/IucC family protein [Streptomyces sp. NPDC088400]|uniref:IucA/IucC family protein n=1 Tax=Streptomyces sp. NPDC088400 TaxID=3365861 RepID=UPI00380CE8E3